MRRHRWPQCLLTAPQGRVQRMPQLRAPQSLQGRLFRRTRPTGRLTTGGRTAASILGSGMAANPVGEASSYGPRVRVSH